ncbi:MAG TPA: TolC family protein [Burkholderiales bacterium]|nr:TolC family protein [Burkholderiales bacterium]
MRYMLGAAARRRSSIRCFRRYPSPCHDADDAPIRWVAMFVAFSLLPASAVLAQEGRDPFRTERYVPASPGMSWKSPVPLPEVPAVPVARLPDPDRALSLPELTELALQNNPRSRQAWYAARAAAAGVGIERADDLPQITASLNFQRSEQGGQAGNQIPWLTRYGPSVTLSYLLFDFGAGASRVRAAEYQALAAALAQNRVLQEVALQVEQAYYRYLGIEQLVRSNELFLKSVSTSLEATQRRREAGLATVADVYRAETQVAQARLNLTRSRGELEKALGALASAAGLPVDTRLRVRPLQGEPRIREVTDSLTEILNRAKANRPDLIAAEAQARAARAQAEAAARSGLPTVTLTATTGRTFFEQERPFTQTNLLALNLNIPLFTGFNRTYSVRQAEARAAQAEAARDALSRQAELEVWQSYYDVQTAVGGVSTTEVQLRAAQQTAEATLARYQAGFGSLLDLITAQVEESNARVQRIQSYLDWFTAVARLNYAIGSSEKLIYPVQAQ